MVNERVRIIRGTPFAAGFSEALACPVHHVLDVVHAIDLVENDGHRDCEDVYVARLEPLDALGSERDLALQVLVGVWLGLDEGSPLAVLREEVLLQVLLELFAHGSFNLTVKLLNLEKRGLK